MGRKAEKMKLYTTEEANNDSAYKEALLSLLYQLADDDLIVAYRGSEWLGLAPHIEEDVAFSSISQDTMGHSAMFYQLLEQLGEGNMDHLAHARSAKERYNAIILEEVNGSGTYLIEPRYDWAFAVVRHYFYTVAKKIRLDSLKNSSFEPLRHAAVKVNMELYYHQLHWKTWFIQLCLANDDAKTRMTQAIEKVLADFDGVLSLGSKKEELQQFGIIEPEEELKTRWLSQMKEMFEKAELDVTLLNNLAMKRGNGRKQEHTSDLEDAIKTLGEVYNMDPAAIW